MKLSNSVRHNFRSVTVNIAVANEMVNLVNYAASAVTGATIKGNGERPSQLIGIKNVFDHDSYTTGRPAPVGKPPGVYTGTLKRSFTTKSARKFRGRVIASGGTDVLYARIHEFGLGKHPKRPFVMKGISTAMPHIERQMKKTEKRVKEQIAKLKEPLQ